MLGTADRRGLKVCAAEGPAPTGKEELEKVKDDAQEQGRDIRGT